MGTRTGEKEFDGRGVKIALLAAVRRIHRVHPRWTLSQCAVFLEVLVAEEVGRFHTHKSICKRLCLPKSTASAVISSLVGDEADSSVLLFKPDLEDRRRRLLATRSERNDLKLEAAFRRAMIEYYGNSVCALVAKSPGESPNP